MLGKYSKAKGDGCGGFVAHWTSLVLSSTRDKARFQELHVGIEGCVNQIVRLGALAMPTVTPSYDDNMKEVAAKVRVHGGCLGEGGPGEGGCVEVVVKVRGGNRGSE